MWKKTADITIRAVLLLSVTSYGVAPASAGMFASPGLPRETNNGSNPMNMPELAPLLAALKGEQSVDHPSRGRTHDSERELPLSQTMTRKIVRDLESIKKECSSYDQVYRIDCLRQGIDMIVASLPDNSEYRDAKRILRKASSRLGRIVAANKDPAAPKLEVPANANPRFKKRRKYTAIKRESVPDAMAGAQKVVDEAATALLRSGENSERRYVHYQEISTAIDSTKVLLRSS